MEGVGGRRVWAPAQSRARVANSARFRAESAAVRPEFAARQLTSNVEMSGYLVGSAAFKAVGTGDPRPAGSIPVHLRHWVHGRPLVEFESPIRWGYSKFDPRTSVTVCGTLLSDLLWGDAGVRVACRDRRVRCCLREVRSHRAELSRDARTR